MSEEWDSDCADPAAATAHCDVCIGQLVVIGTELMDALIGPAQAGLDAFADAAITLQRRMRWGARKLLAGIEATATALGPMPALPVLAPTGGPGSSGAGRASPPDYLASDLPAVPPDDLAPGADHVASPAATPPPELHDVDQPNLLVLADREQSWHQRLRAYHSGAMDPVLLAPTLAAAVAQRESQAAERLAAAPQSLASQLSPW